MALSKKQRQRIFDKFGGKCSYCGCDLKKGWHVDHAEPLMRISNWDRDKGKFVQTGECQNPEREIEDNYMPACASCNIAKSTLNIEDFRAFITRFIESLNKYSVQYKIAKRYGLIKETGIKLKFYFETLQQTE